MPHHHIGSRINGCLGDLPFVHADGRRGVPEPFVQGHHQNVDFLPECFDIGRHSLERVWIGKRVYRGWTARRCMIQFVMRQDMYIRATRSISLGPRLARSHTVVAEKSQAQPLPFHNRRLPCLGQIHARAGGREAQAAEFGDRVLHPIRSGVGDVIAGQRRNVESRTLERRKVRRIAGRCWNIEMRLYAPRRMRNFDVPHQDVARLELMTSQVKQDVGILLVENQVAGYLQSKKITHGNTTYSGDLYT